MLDLADFAFKEQPKNNLMVAISRGWYNSWYTMATKPTETLDLHNPMITFSIMYKICHMLPGSVISEHNVVWHLSFHGTILFLFTELATLFWEDASSTSGCAHAQGEIQNRKSRPLTALAKGKSLKQVSGYKTVTGHKNNAWHCNGTDGPYL